MDSQRHGERMNATPCELLLVTYRCMEGGRTCVYGNTQFCEVIKKLLVAIAIYLD